MLKKKKLLCAAIMGLAIGGFAGNAFAATLTQNHFINKTGGVQFDEVNGRFYFSSGDYIIDALGVDITSSGESMSNSFNLKISSGVTMEVRGGIDRSITGNEDLGLLNVTALYIDGGNLIIEGSAITYDDGATPPEVVSSAAVAVHNHMYHSGGTIKVTGGSGDAADGLVVVQEYNLSGGQLISTGGSGNSAWGTTIGANKDQNDPERDLEQTGGSIVATGGTGLSSYGVYVYGSVNLKGGSITANGGDGINASGLVTEKSFFQTGGSVTASGGDTGAASVGIEVGGTYILDNGSLNATGGDAPSSPGVYAGSFSQNGGFVVATGSANSANSYGIWVGNTGGQALYMQTGGALTAQGNMASGLIIRDIGSTGKFEQRGGIVNATGGSSDNAYGIDANEYEQKGGTLNATGGQIAEASGFNAGVVSDTFTQVSGSISASGGNVDNSAYASSGASGIAATTFIQKAGAIVSYGGSNENGRDVYGIFAVNFTQETGIVKSFGGAGTNAYGFYIDNAFSGSTAQIGGYFAATAGQGANAYGLLATADLTLNNGGQLHFTNNYNSTTSTLTRAVQINGNFTANAGSTLSPTVDLYNRTVGTINASTITLDATGDGVVLDTKFKNTLFYDQSITTWQNQDFLNASGGITGDFVNVVSGIPQESLFFEYKITMSGNTAILEVTDRIRTMAEVLPSVGENAQSLFTGIANGLLAIGAANVAGDATLSALNDVYSELESAKDLADFQNKANYFQQRMTNHGGTRLVHYGMQQMDVVQNTLNQEIFHAQKLPYWQVWTKAVFVNASDISPKTNEFTKGKEDFSGIVIGAARDFRYLTLSGQAHYLTGTVKSQNVYKADTDNFGFIVGARIHDVVNPKAVFNPWFDINFAYSSMNADQKRVTIGSDFIGNLYETTATSKAKSNIFRLGFAMGNTFDLGGFATITPQIGFNYTNINQKGYTESSDGLALRTGKSTFESLRPKIGAEAEVYLSEYLTASFRAFYHYEVMDQRIIYNNSFAGAPSVNFKTYGEKTSRSSGNLGVGLNVGFTEQVSAGIAYDLWLRDKYTAHQFAVELRVNF